METTDMRELDFCMSNFDRTIDEGFSEALQAEPGKVLGRHFGWNFNGNVYFSNGQFHEEVWVYGSPRKTISAPTLSELMDAVCSEYGYD